MELTFLISRLEKHHYLMTASLVKGILLSDLLKCGEGKVQFRMEEIIFLSLHQECLYLTLPGK